MIVQPITALLPANAMLSAECVAWSCHGPRLPEVEHAAGSSNDRPHGQPSQGAAAPTAAGDICTGGSRDLCLHTDGVQMSEGVPRAAMHTQYVLAGCSRP